MTPEQFTYLVCTKRDEMVRIARARLRRVGLAHEAEDFVQTALTKMLAHHEYITAGEAIGGYFATVIMNEIKDYLARQKRSVEPTAQAFIDLMEGVSEVAAREKLQLDVHLALEALPDPRARTIAWLTYAEGMSTREVGKHVGVSYTTVQTVLNETVLPVLRAVLAPYRASLTSRPSRPLIKEGVVRRSPETAVPVNPIPSDVEFWQGVTGPERQTAPLEPALAAG